MSEKLGRLEKIQQLVLDIAKVQRNHRIPGEERRENVVEHSFSVAMLCWELFEMIHPPLVLERILKYALIHDFLERGQRHDVNTFASEGERKVKKELEANELTKINEEFGDFKDFLKTLHAYEALSDEETLFVWSVDKMQHLILGGIDNWRPYELYGVTYDQFYKKGEDIFNQCSPYLKGILGEVLAQSRKTYYDRPDYGR